MGKYIARYYATDKIYITPQFSHHFIQSNRTKVTSTRSRIKSKRKVISSAKEIVCGAACISLNLPFSYSVCTTKIEKDINLCAKDHAQKTNFRVLNRRNKCEQRWSE